MSTLVRKPAEQKLGEGIYRAVIATIEGDVASRFTSREDLVRVGLDLTEEVEGEKPRLWLVAAPSLQGRLLALVEAALTRKLTAEEAEGLELEDILGKEVQVVIARVPGRAGVSFSRIVTFLPVRD